jgi:DNA helicase HerA-like ATPase
MQNRRWLVLGTTGSGKSYFTSYLISKYIALKQRKHIVIVDSTDSYKEGLSWLKHCDVPPVDFSSIDFESIISQNPYVLFEVSGLLPVQDVAFLDSLCLAIMNVGDVFFVCDEAHRYLPKDKPSNQFLILLREGRKRYIDPCLITQFPVDLNLIARRQANSLVVFKLLDDTDTERTGFYLEMRPEEIMNLKLYEFILKDRDTGESVRGTL